MANIVFNVGTGRTYPDMQDAVNAIPADVVASGNNYFLSFPAGEYVMPAPVVIANKVTGPNNKIILCADTLASFFDNPNILTLPYAFMPAQGAALRGHFGYKDPITVDSPNVNIIGLQIFNSSVECNTTVYVSPKGGNFNADRCIFDNAGYRSFASCLNIAANDAVITNTLVVQRSNVGCAIYCHTPTTKIENVAIVSPSSFTSDKPAIKNASGGTNIRNTVALNFDVLTSAAASGDHNACTGTISFGTDNKPNLVFANQVVNTLNDFRVKAGSALIDAGGTPSTNNTQAPNGVRQQGTAADIGAWETPNSLVAPSATVTAVSVTGQNVTISGTTTGVPTSGTASASPAALAYNSAETSGPTKLTLGSGTFTVTFSGLKVGKYNIQFQVVNSGYTSSGQNPLGTFDIVGATATVTQDAMSGQVLRISGTISGSPTSGQLIVPAAATNPNGATDQTKAITITGSTYEVSITLPPGNYDPGILRLTNAAGTSLPQPGTSAVSVIGIDGNPVAPEDTGSNPPTVTSVTISPTTATGSTTFSAVVAGTNSPSQGVSWTASAGTISSAGVFTAPAATSSVQNITVTATSLVDTTKSGTAAVTIAAGAAATVTSVTVSPGTATDSSTFTAVVNGTNSPPQSVTWTASAGSISSSGVFTAPAKTSSIQTITITARSTFDTTKTGTATVTLAATAPVSSTVTGVTVSPGTATGSTTFSATVSGTNSPSQAVTWTASAGAISSSGVFTAPAATSSVQSITITARSVQDSTKAGTATVTIAATTPAPQRSVSFMMRNAASLSGLTWSWFDQALPNNFAAPTDKGAIESTDANGLIVIPLPNSQLPTGGIGWIIVTNSDGNPAKAHSAFCGPRVVS